MKRVAPIAALVVVLVWLALGLRTVDRQLEFGVLHGPLLGGSARRVDGGWTLAPPGLLRLALYPKAGLELSLPQAEAADLPGVDGSRYGLRGFLTVRANPERWRELHAAANGQGLNGAVATALRQAAPKLPDVSRTTPMTAVYRTALERELDSELASVGLYLRRLEVDSFDYLAVEGAVADADVDARLLVVGLDGADWGIIDELIEQGRLPHLQALIENGARAKLLSISPMLSPVIWTSAATGVEPIRHGILDFLVADPETGQRQPVTSAQRLVPTVWEILSQSGVDVGVVGWWASWPADAVRGYMVSDRIAYQLFGYSSDPADRQGKTWPPDLYDDVRPWIVDPPSIGWDRLRPYLAGERREPSDFSDEERELLDQMRTLIASGETYLEISKQLSRRFRPELEVVYFEGTDTAGHLFMPYRLPALPGVDPQRIDSFNQIVDRYYEEADRFLGELLEEKGEEWTVMVLSDHGFASDRNRPRTTDSRIGHGGAADWHRRFGILVLSGANVRKGVRIEEASIYDIAPTILALFGQPVPQSWPGRVLSGALSESFVAENPVRLRSDDPTRQTGGAEWADDPSAAALMEKLQSLGYISSGGGSGADAGSEALTALNNQGISLLAEGRFEEAEAEFRKGLEVAPGSAMFRFNLALAARFQGRIDEAKQLLRESLQFPGTLEMSGATLADMLIDDGELEEAAEVVDRVLEFEPDSSEAVSLRGRIYELGGDPSAAREAYMRSAELDPDAPLPRNHLGNMAKQAGNREEAQQWYQRAIEADPYFMGAYNNLALVYQELGEIPEAIDLYQRALTKAPNNAIVINNLASLYFATGDQPRARGEWERAIRVDPEYPSPLNNLAGLEITQGNLSTAEELLGRALALDGNYGDARINLAIVHNARQRFDAARQELQLATQDERARNTAWFQLGSFELQQGYVDAAIDALDRASAITPNRAQVWNLLGEAQRRVGRRDDALRSWRRSLSLNPNQPQIRQGVTILEGNG